MELRNRATVATLYCEADLSPSGRCGLGEDAAHHARVRRLAVGDAIQLTDGRGHLASGSVASLVKDSLDVVVESVMAMERSPAVHLFVPVADRDRMLWLAEKATELGVTGWHPVLFHRSQSVASRGVGEAFERKLRARMISALEQSTGAWLPEIHAPLPLSDVLGWNGATKVVMDRDGPPLSTMQIQAPAGAVIGPEGGLEPEELEALAAAGWTRSRLGENTLRFETAGIAAVTVLRVMLANH